MKTLPSLHNFFRSEDKLAEYLASEKYLCNSFLWHCSSELIFNVIENII